MPVFGETEGDTSPALVVEKLSLGRGLAETPNLHLSDGGGDEGDADDGGGIKAFIQTTTGTIVEVPQESLPIKNYRTGKTSWKGLSIE
jgi:type IV pilus assembly protein PilY1